MYRLHQPECHTNVDYHFVQRQPVCCLNFCSQRFHSANLLSTVVPKVVKCLEVLMSPAICQLVPCKSRCRHHSSIRRERSAVPTIKALEQDHDLETFCSIIENFKFINLKNKKE